MENIEQYYGQWKQTAQYSQMHQTQQQEKASFQKNAEKFFACTNMDMQERQAIIDANKPIDPKTIVKNQFTMDKKQSHNPQHRFVGNPDFETSNAFYHQMTNNSAVNLSSH